MNLKKDKARSLLHNLPQALAYNEIIFDQEGQPVDCLIRDINCAFSSLTGLSPEEVTGKRLPDIFSAMGRDNFDWLEICEQLAWSSQPITFEQYFPSLERWLKILACRDEEGFFVSIFQDITGERQKEFDLQVNQFALDKADLLVFRVTPGGELEYVNETACKKLGYTRGELIGKSSRIFIPGEQYIKWPDFWSNLQKKKSLVYERFFQDKKGNFFPVQISSRYYRYGNKEYELALAQDITEQKRAQQELEEQVQLQQLLTQLATGLINIPLDQVDAGIKEMLGKIGSQIKVQRVGVFAHDYIREISHLNYEWEGEEGINSKTGLTAVPFEIWGDRLDILQAGKNIHIPMVVELPEQHSIKTFLQEEGIRSLLCLPLMYEGVNIGFLKFDALGEEKIFSENEMSLLRVAGEIVASVLARKQTEKEIRHASFNDSLTGLYNRYFIEEEIDRLNTRRQLPLSLIMADVNGLKLVNDTYGYDRGDEMLKKTADILRKSCREEDIIARWGGDEFLILLPQTTRVDAGKIVGRILQQCKNISVNNIPVSLSLGTGCKENAEIDLAEVLRATEDDMFSWKLTQSRKAKSAVVKGLLTTLEQKSFEGPDHIRRMQEIAGRIARKIALPASEISRLELLIALHDIGTINIPAGILKRKSPLSAEEWELIKKHPAIGHRIAQATVEFAHVAEDILSHHEHWDGSGYPQGLAGNSIPILSRITSIVDAFDVMTAGRPYRKKISAREALKEIKRCSGSQFDPELVEVMEGIMAK